MAISFVAEAHGSTAYGTSISVNKPAGTVDGDVMIAICGGTPSTPSGWTLVGSADSGTNSLRTVKVFRKVASSEGSSYSFTISSSLACASIVSYRGASTVTPVDTVNFDVSSVGASTNFNTSSVTSAATQWGVSFAMGYEYGSSSTRTWTEGSGTERSDFSVTATSENCNCAATDSNANLSAGSFSRTQTRSAAASGGVTSIVLLNQLGGGNVLASAGAAAASVSINDVSVSYGIAGSAGKAAATVSAKSATVLAGRVVTPGVASATVALPDIGRRSRPGTANAVGATTVAHVYYGAPHYRTFIVPADTPMNPEAPEWHHNVGN